MRIRWGVSAALALLLFLAVAGCGARHTEQASNTPASGTGSSEKATMVASTEIAGTQAASTKGPAGGQVITSPGSKAKRAGTIHRITLSQRRCIRFDPQWTSIRVGQSLTWHSELKTPLTIYISPGIFPRDNYTIQPGQTVTTGPAQSPGRYSFWTEPCACREAPRGVLLAGPGVRVQDTFYASAPGIRPGIQ